MGVFRLMQQVDWDLINGLVAKTIGSHEQPLTFLANSHLVY
jgi:hypothetical protein